jgi:two-component system response regulator LytT
MIRAIIVDDEVMARESLSMLLEKFEDISVSNKLSSAEETLVVLKSEKVDVLFLDVEMPGLSGLDMLEVARELPRIVLTTNNADYAVEAFEYDVVDFIKKPVTYKRLVKTIERLRESLSPEVKSENFFVRSEGKHVRIDLEKLLYVETMDDYVVLIMEDKSKHIVHSTLSAMDQRLPDNQFFRVHRSYLVNLERIDDVDETSLVIQRNVIPVSRAYRKPLKERLRL